MRPLLALLIVCLLISCNTVTERMPHYAVHGIDVSHYQSQINWDTIAVQNLDFAFVKASEGESISDSLFCNNWDAIKRVGMKRGAYHFFRPTVPALNQAHNFISQVRLEPGDMPPVLDIEVVDGVDGKTLRENLRSWLQIVERYYNIRPIIYTNLNFYQKYIDEYFDEYPVWIARYNTKKPYLGNDRNWLFWQYGNRGKLAGINGFVDFNVFDGTLLELHNLCIPEAQVYCLND